ncbi:Lysine histidine transporter 1 [Acorus calamus]|uniref:Lysine histidine transporter 1 n=1 Tax=Acorus calamus TaxID=4465 RepID=A0AAV9CPM4_ACOCL|nr:Lysine histidine transporter 1 [Acorus calamus]
MGFTDRVFASDTTKFDPASLSVLLDTQPDPDISASLNYRFFVDPQEPFDLSSTLQPSQLPIMSTTNFSTTNTFSPDPTAAIPTQSLQSVYEQQECLAQLQPSPTPLTATSNMTSLDESTFKVGRLSVEEKKERINRFMKKRNERNFRKKIKVSTQSEKEKEIEDRLPITSSRNGEMYSAFYNVTAMVDTGVVSLPELG